VREVQESVLGQTKKAQGVKMMSDNRTPTYTTASELIMAERRYFELGSIRKTIEELTKDKAVLRMVVSTELWLTLTRMADIEISKITMSRFSDNIPVVIDKGLVGFCYGLEFSDGSSKYWSA
jgi:hypothetical protein